jgi:outer membrane protein OmpA-like peptidoglycan-associated protein
MLRNSVVVLLLLTFTVSCASSGDNDKTQKGAAAGAAAGAVAGAVIGNQSGNNRTGAVVGGVAGAVIGAAIGRRMDQQEKELRQIEGVEVTRPSEGEIEVRMTSDILFDVDSSALRPESRSTLRDLASTFSRYSDINVIEVAGHTDSTGSDSHNDNLSQNRAGSVRNYLVEQGVPSSRIVARGFGERQPKAGNGTPEGRQLNRRVEIHIRAQESGT